MQPRIPAAAFVPYGFDRHLQRIIRQLQHHQLLARRLRNGANEATKAVVTELRPLGTFATWQAERVIGDHDRNTLRLRLDPQGDAATLEPGMTVWIEK